ncbi:MAG: type II secretion system F family protein, partial [Deltaproteobacteria bacterium]|nr:type II secretion system F family protein [Deltaproteobacteria bacterium]
VSARLLSLTTRQLATLLSSGTALSEALTILSANTADRRLKSIILKVNESVIEGSSLARALEQYPDVFSTFYRGLVTAGEASGSLDKVLPRLADYLEARAKLSSDVKAALTYPALMTIVGAGVLSFLFIFVIPRITRVFEDTQSALPFMTVVLISVTGVLSRWWPVAAVTLAASVWAAARYLKTGRGRDALDRLVPRIPLIGNLAASFHVSSLTRTLGSLLKGGVQLLRALDITREVVGNAVYDGILRDAKEGCMGGASLSSSLARHKAVPPIVVHMISVGEKSGTLDEMLLKTADAYDLEFNSGVKRALNLLEPLLILAMGLVVGFIVLAILLPIFELNQVVR